MRDDSDATPLSDCIKEYCEDEIISQDLMQWPFIQEIYNKSFVVDGKTTDQLINSLITYSYLNEDSGSVCGQILWLLGGDENEFNKYFVKTKGNKYIFKESIPDAMKRELARYLKSFGNSPPYRPEALSVRFQTISTINCVRANNLRLIEWAGINGKLTTFTEKSNIKDVFEETAHNSCPEMLRWLNNHGLNLFDENGEEKKKRRLEWYKISMYDKRSVLDKNFTTHDEEHDSNHTVYKYKVYVKPEKMEEPEVEELEECVDHGEYGEYDEYDECEDTECEELEYESLYNMMDIVQKPRNDNRTKLRPRTRMRI
jgi:hypothetical protein